MKMSVNANVLSVIPAKAGILFFSFLIIAAGFSLRFLCVIASGLAAKQSHQVFSIYLVIPAKAGILLYPSPLRERIG